MSYLLTNLTCKEEVDHAIRENDDLLVVLRFGRAEDAICLQQDDILSKTENDLKEMARIYLVNVDSVPEYVKYFDITLIPATVFFFNAQHMKCDYGTPDHSKWIGSFASKQDFIDLVEIFYRGAMKGKLIVNCPIERSHIPQYKLIYKGL